MNLNGSGIYMIKCVSNEKFYIGSAVKFSQRWNEHRSELRRGIHVNGRLQNSWNKYGESNFVFSIVQIVLNRDDLRATEQQWMDKTKCYHRDIGFNISDSAFNPMLGKFGELNPFYGKKHSVETRRKMSELAKIRTSSSKERQRLSDMNKGRKASKETRDKMSKSHTGMTCSEISKVKRRGENHHGSTIDEATVKNMRKDKKQSMSVKNISIKYKVSYHIAYDVVKYRSWKHIS